MLVTINIIILMMLCIGFFLLIMKQIYDNKKFAKALIDKSYESERLLIESIIKYWKDQKDFWDKSIEDKNLESFHDQFQKFSDVCRGAIESLEIHLMTQPIRKEASNGTVQ